MKWSELTLKERKKIYDTVRAENPNATYFDIKSQFDSIPAYEDGKGSDKKPAPPKELGYTPGTPEYFARQRRISGRAETIQPEAYVTPAGYIKDAINVTEDLVRGDYSGAALDAAANILPWGTGKLVKKIKAGARKTAGAVNESSPSKMYSTNFVEPFTPTITTKKGRSKMSDVDAALVKQKLQEATDLATGKKARAENIRNYEKEIGQIVWDAYNPEDWYMLNRIQSNDKLFGTNYEKAYKQILKQDLRNRGNYVEWDINRQGAAKDIGYDEVMSPNHNGYTDLKPSARKKLEKDPNYVPTVDDFVIKINADSYTPGVANHELSHLADALETGKFNDTMSNRYLDYLLDEDNLMNPVELQRRGIYNISKADYDYLRTPTEAKAHMLNLRRGLLQKGKIGTFLQPISKDIVEDALNTNLLNNTALIKQYQMYRNKDRFIQRLNNLNPMGLVPLGYLSIGLTNQKEE